MIDSVTFEEISGDKIVIIRVHKDADISTYMFCLTAVIIGDVCELKGLKDAKIEIKHIRLIGGKLYSLNVKFVKWTHHKKEFCCEILNVNGSAKKIKGDL